MRAVKSQARAADPACYRAELTSAGFDDLYLREQSGAERSRASLSQLPTLV